MKKKFIKAANALMFGAFAMSSLSLASCSDDLDIKNSNNNQTQITDSDLTKGVNVFVCAQDTIYNARVPLSINTNVTAIADNNIVSMNCLRDAQGNTYLQPSLLTVQDTTVTTSVKLQVPQHEEMNKSIIVSIRPSGLATRAALKEQVQDRLTDVMSYGVYGSLLPGELNVEHPALNASALKAYVENHQNFRMDARTFMSYGTSIKEVADKWQSNTGWKASGDNKMCDALKINFNKDNSVTKKHEREYLVVDGQDYKAFGLLSDELATEQANSDKWIEILDTRLNDILHNPKKCEKSYPLTKEGTMNLIAAYGSHIPTQALLGSGIRLETSKTIDVVDQSLGFGISVAAAKYSDNTAAFMAKAAKMYTAGGNSVAQSGNISYEQSKKDYAANTDQKYEVITIGNGTFDGNKWVAGSEPSDWQALAYCCSGTNLRQPRMIPLYELISETAKKSNPDVQKRYDLLKEAIDVPANSEYPAYLTYFKYVTPEESTAHYVICDFVVKTEDNVNPQPFPGKVMCKDNKMHEVMYYPMRWNNNAGTVAGDGGWKYTALDTRADAFLGYLQKKHQHFYYAIIQSSLHDGIDAITFVPEDSYETINPFIANKNRGKDYESAGWTRRSYDGTTCADVCSGVSCDKVAPYVHYRNANSKTQPISAVCLFEDTQIAVLASSAGTEYDEKNAQYTANFNIFWKDGQRVCANTTSSVADANHWYHFTDKGGSLDQTKYYSTSSACAYGWFRASGWVSQPHHLYVGYSFKTLPTVLETSEGTTPLVALAPKTR